MLRRLMGRLAILILGACALAGLPISTYAQNETPPTPPAEEAPAEGETETTEPAVAEESETAEEAEEAEEPEAPASDTAAPAAAEESAPVAESTPATAEPATAEASEAEVPPTAAETPAAPNPQPDTPSNVETPAPTFYVLSMPSERMREQPEPVMAVQSVVFSHVQGQIEGRPVELLRIRERLEAIMGCADDHACVSQQLTELGAAGAMVIRTDRGARRGVDVALELHWPSAMSTTAPDVTRVEADISRRDLETPAESLSEALASLNDQLPEAPRVSTMLLAINVPGARVTVDGEPVGESPMAPIDARRGRRAVAVHRDGFETYRRTVNVGLSEDIRVNIDLVPEEGTNLVLGETGDYTIASDTGETPWYKEWYVWAGAGGAVVLTAVIIGVAASGDDVAPDPSGFRIPPIE